MNVNSNEGKSGERVLISFVVHFCWDNRVALFWELFTFNSDSDPASLILLDCRPVESHVGVFGALDPGRGLDLLSFDPVLESNFKPESKAIGPTRTQKLELKYPVYFDYLFVLDSLQVESQ